MATKEIVIWGIIIVVAWAVIAAVLIKNRKKK